MSVSKIFKRLAHKNTPKPSRDAAPASDVPAEHGKDASSKTLVGDVVAPTFPDNLKAAWAAANKKPPQAQGVEKFLNRVGASVSDGSVRAVVLKWIFRECTE